jgi:hypothetical protein
MTNEISTQNFLKKKKMENSEKMIQELEVLNMSRSQFIPFRNKLERLSPRLF